MDKPWKLLLFRKGLYMKRFSADNTWCKVVKKKKRFCLPILCSHRHPSVLPACVPGASSSGWRWGKCVRCATCLFCNWPSRQAAWTPLGPYSSPSRGSRTWCSRRGPPPCPAPSSFVVHYSHKHPSIVISPVQVLVGWFCGQATGKRECTDIHNNNNNKLCIRTSLFLTLVHKKRMTRFDFWLMNDCFTLLFFGDNEEKLMKKKF